MATNTDNTQKILDAIEKHNMIFLSAQEDKVYFHWQIELYMYQFKQHGITDRCYVLIGHKANNPSKGAQRLKKLYPDNIIFYKDERVKSCYTPNIRPHIYKKFFRDYPHLGKNVFFHDSDIFLVKLPRFDLMLHDYDFVHDTETTNTVNTTHVDDTDDIPIVNTRKTIKRDMVFGTDATKGYVSDTINYIGYKYIKGCCDRYYKVHSSKPNYDKFDIFTKMCEAVGVDEDIVRKRNAQSGGAQYLLKNMNYEFWDECEKANERLYGMFLKYEKSYPIPHHIQKWTTDMWTCLLLYWKRGDDTIVDKQLDFSWATGTARQYRIKNIFHLAGVTGDQKKRFNKGKYHAKCVFEEYNKNRCIFDHVDSKNATFEYVKVMKEYFNKHYAPEKGYLTDEAYFNTPEGKKAKLVNRDDFGNVIKTNPNKPNKPNKLNANRQRPNRLNRINRKRVNPLQRIISKQTDFDTRTNDINNKQDNTNTNNTNNKTNVRSINGEPTVFTIKSTAEGSVGQFDGTYELTDKKCCNKYIWCSDDDMYIIYHNGNCWTATYKQFEDDIGRGTGGIASCFSDKPYINGWNQGVEIIMN
jgi:hypothetical protein